MLALFPSNSHLLISSLFPPSYLIPFVYSRRYWRDIHFLCVYTVPYMKADSLNAIIIKGGVGGGFKALRKIRHSPTIDIQ